MHTATLVCHDDQRRESVRQKAGLNGLDYLNVSSDQRTLTVYFLGKAPVQLLRRESEEVADYNKRLRESVQVEGGRRIRGLRVTDVEIHQATDSKTGTVLSDLDDWMDVRLDKYGDFSIYTLRLVGVENIDPRYDHLDFSFKVDCPSDLDCAPVDTCPPPKLDEPYIDYLAKDYDSFRQLILDRLSIIMPDWRERHVPDLELALVEVIAYVGDHLSYYQDAVASEAYLDTARQRISVRRHARLVDYQMHEGCNARAWVCIETDQDQVFDPGQVFFITHPEDALLKTNGVLSAEVLQQIPVQQYEVFEPMTTEAIRLYAGHSRTRFYTWGQSDCCLPRGATSATLRDAYIGSPAPLRTAEQDQHPAGPPSSAKNNETPAPSAELQRRLHLQVGDVLIFEEVVGPRTGSPADADPAHRHAIRLTRVTEAEDTLYEPPIPVLEIEWAVEDAVPFSLCISSITDASHGCHLIEDVSIVHGNVLLVDHGRTLPPEDLGIVPCVSSQAECACADHSTEITFLPGRFRPVLTKTPLTFRQPLPAEGTAARLLLQDVRQALPQVIALKSIPAAPAMDCESLQPLFRPTDLLDLRELVASLRAGASPAAQALRSRLTREILELMDQLQEGEAIPEALSQPLTLELSRMLLEWSARSDLLSSEPDEQHFVVEMDNDRIAHLRFGDNELGQVPEAGSAFFASYRVGNGIVGNVGAEAISHLVLRDTVISGLNVSVRNPLPARGGSELEPIEEVKLFAPFEFRKQFRRAITAHDYAQVVQRDFKEQVQRAAGTFVWTGSWYEARVAADPFSSQETNRQFLDAIGSHLYRYRRIGHDVGVIEAQYVPLDIELVVCVLPHYLRGHVKAALLDIFSNRVLPNGRLGFFHSDRLTFGEGVYLSKLVAAAQAVTGVESVTVRRLQRLYEGDQGELRDGVLRLGPLEVAQLDNDPSFPERGRLMLDIRGER